MKEKGRKVVTLKSQHEKIFLNIKKCNKKQCHYENYKILGLRLTTMFKLI